MGARGLSLAGEASVVDAIPARSSVVALGDPGPILGNGGPGRGGEAVAPPRPGLVLAPLGRLRAFARRRRLALTIVGSLVTAALLAVVLNGRRHEFSAALSGPRGTVLAAAVVLQIVALRLAQRGVAPVDRGGGRDGRAPRPLPRVEHAGAGQRAQRAARGGGADRGAATLLAGGQPPGADAHRRRVPDPRGRGGAGRADVVHPGRPARPAVVAAARRPGGDRGRQRRAAPTRPAQGPRAVARASPCCAACAAAAG